MTKAALAVETSCSIASVACINKDGYIDRIVCSKNTRHAESILPAVQELLERNGMQLSDLEEIYTDIGPGSFTGVRIGVTAANALAYALHIPLYEVDSLSVLYEMSQRSGTVCACIDARNRNAYAAVFQNGMLLRSPEAVSLEEYLPTLPEKCTFCGDIPVLCAHFDYPDAAGVIRAVSSGRGHLCTEARPLYLRPSQAERMREGR